jgi:hypothetical protein
MEQLAVNFNSLAEIAGLPKRFSAKACPALDAEWSRLAQRKGNKI